MQWAIPFPVSGQAGTEERNRPALQDTYNMFVWKAFGKRCIFTRNKFRVKAALQPTGYTAENDNILIVVRLQDTACCCVCGHNCFFIKIGQGGLKNNPISVNINMEKSYIFCCCFISLLCNGQYMKGWWTMERLGRYLMSIGFTRDDMQGMEGVLLSFLSKMNVTLSVPVDIFELADQLGFDVRGAAFDEHMEGLIVVNEFEDKIDGFESNKVIAYNCKKSIEQKKFIVAHELAHYIWEKSQAKEKRVVVAARDHQGKYSTNEMEQRMDYIAASLLVPKDHLIDSGITDPVKVAEMYRVPEDLARRRLQEVAK